MFEAEEQTFRGLKLRHHENRVSTVKRVTFRGNLFVILSQNFSGGGIHKMELIAGKAGHGFVGIALVRGLLGGIALNPEAGGGAAENKRRLLVFPMLRFIQKEPRLR